MKRGRLEAFSDGVIAIIITIMVLELEVPEEPSLAALKPLWALLSSYVLSFLYVGIYWNNHHHLLQSVESVNGASLWANLHLLFWLSLVPFASAWMGATQYAPLPVTLYGVVLLMAGVAYRILTVSLIRVQGANYRLHEAVGRDHKGMLSIGVYLLAIGISFINHWAALFLYLLVALAWLIPDRRIEKAFGDEESPSE